MPQFAANLSMMYTELPFMQRFTAAAQDGFKAVEYLFPYAFSKQELAQELKTHGLQQVLFNAPPGGVLRQRLLAMHGTWRATVAQPPCRGVKTNSKPGCTWH
jgi:hydroxypyruvate isomerase